MPRSQKVGPGDVGGYLASHRRDVVDLTRWFTELGGASLRVNHAAIDDHHIAFAVLTMSEITNHEFAFGNVRHQRRFAGAMIAFRNGSPDVVDVV